MDKLRKEFLTVIWLNAACIFTYTIIIFIGLYFMFTFNNKLNEANNKIENLMEQIDYYNYRIE
jgi:hypothetical protein